MTKQLSRIEGLRLCQFFSVVHGRKLWGRETQGWQSGHLLDSFYATGTVAACADGNDGVLDEILLCVAAPPLARTSLSAAVSDPPYHVRTSVIYSLFIIVLLCLISYVVLWDVIYTMRVCLHFLAMSGTWVSDAACVSPVCRG